MTDSYAWNGTDPVAVQDWNYLHMFYKACRERAWAAGFGEFPPCAMAFMDGSSSAVTHEYTPSTITTITPTSVKWTNGVLDTNIIKKINHIPQNPEPDIPTAWAVICGAYNYDEPYNILRGTCTAYDEATGVMTVQWNNPWRLRWGPEGLDQFVGKEIVVIPSGSGWPWWHERVPARPSDYPQFSGRVLQRDADTPANVWPFVKNWGSTEDVVDDYGALRDDFDLVVGSNRWRINAIADDAITVRLEAGESLPQNTEGYAAIIKATAFWSELAKHDAYQWYTGVHTTTTTVLPNSENPYRGQLGTHYVPQYTYVLNPGPNQQSFPLMDTDLWLPWKPEDGVEDPSVCKNVSVTKSVRYLQTWIAGAAYSFVKQLPEGETYEHSRAIPNEAVRVFVDAGISGSKEGLNVTWNYEAYVDNYSWKVTATADKPEWYESWMGPLMYAIVCDTWSEKPIKYGMVGLGEDGKFHFDFDALYWFVQDNKTVFWPGSYTPVDSYSVYLTPGWRRQVPAAIRYFYSKTCLLPAISQDEWGNEYVVTPQDDPEKCGGFYKRPRSTTYEDGSPFEDGQRARYTGDSRFDPPTMMNGDSIDKDYRAKWYTGHPVSWPSPYLAQGSITAIDKHCIRDAAQDWHIEGTRFWHGAIASGGTTTSFVAHRKANIADVGGTVTLTIGSQTGSFSVGETVTQEVTNGRGTIMGGYGNMMFVQITSGYFEAETSPGNRTVTGLTSGATGEVTNAGGSPGDDGLCSHSAFWSAPDMLGNARFTDFVAEIRLDGVWYYRPITGHDLATQTISWTEPLQSAVQEGDVIRIAEPLYELNRWQERQVEITLAACDVPKLDNNGNPIEGEFVHFAAFTITTTITHNDKTRLFIDQTVELPCAQTVDGRVYTRSLDGCTYKIIEYLPGEVWERQDGKWVRPESDLPLENLAPTLLERFGLASKWDYVCRSSSFNVFDQMRRVLNKLTWTRVDGGFSPYTNANHDTRSIIEDPAQVAGWPYAVTLDVAHEGNAQWAAGQLLANYPMQENSPGQPGNLPKLWSGDGAFFCSTIGFDVVSENHDGCAYRDFGAADPYGYGPVRVQRGLGYARAGGYPDVSAVGDLHRLTGGVEIYVFCQQGGQPFLETQYNPNRSQYLDYLSEEMTYALVGGATANWHVHSGGLICPPSAWPTINTSMMPTHCLGDSPVPPGYPFEPHAQIGWSGSVTTVWKWGMHYGPPAAA